MNPKGTIITCEIGHPICEAAVDIMPPHIRRLAAIDNTPHLLS